MNNYDDNDMLIPHVWVCASVCVLGGAHQCKAKAQQDMCLDCDAPVCVLYLKMYASVFFYELVLHAWEAE